MTLIDQINALRQQMRAERDYEEKLVDAVTNRLIEYAIAKRNFHAAFGSLLEQPLRDPRNVAEQINRFADQHRNNQSQSGPYRGPYEGGGYQ